MDTHSPQPKRDAAPPPIGSAIGANRRLKVVAVGRPRRFVADAYVRLMEMKWRQLILLFGISFILFNTVFAALYWLQPGSLSDSGKGDAESFRDAFFFSVQTVATIGYGVLSPQTLYANLLVTAEIMAGVLGIAMWTGLMFARVSRPTARIMFSKVAVITPHDGVPMLMFRAANQRHNLILEAHVRLALARMETSMEGRTMRRFHDLTVERRDNLTFLLSWTVMHAIDASSPLYGTTPEALAASDLEIIVVMTGTDESFAQPVHARHVYAASDIVWGKQFVDILSFSANGRRIIDYGRFHDVEPA